LSSVNQHLNFCLALFQYIKITPPSDMKIACKMPTGSGSRKNAI
jgi:hypothetical protein